VKPPFDPELPRRYALVVSDIDGTLLDTQHSLRPESVQAVHEARGQGLRLTFASGRNRIEVVRFLEILGLREPYIALGGAFVGDPGQALPIAHEALGPQEVELILQLARREALSILFEDPDHVWFQGSSQEYQALRRMTESEIDWLEPGESLADRELSKIVLIGMDGKLRRAEADLAAAREQIAFARSMPTFLDITKAGATKGRALGLLAAHMGIPAERIAVIGDGPNDVSMFALAGLSIAMANASVFVRAAADLVAPSNDKDGFAWAMHEVLRQK